MANIIIFDGLYTSDQIRNIGRAEKLVEAAVQDIKRAAAHRGWRCPEARNLDDSLQNIERRLNRIEHGLIDTRRVLSQGLQNFAELEERASGQADNLSDNLRERSGIQANVHGQNEQRTLPVTEIPQQNESWIENIVKGAAKNIIQISCTAIGGIIGAVKGGIDGIARGLITDIKDGIVDSVVGIFNASQKLLPPSDESGKALLDVFTNSIGLIGTCLGIGGEEALKNVSKISDAEKLLGTICSESSNAFSTGTAIGTSIADPEQLEEQLMKIGGIITDTITPFGLDQTILQGVDGIGKGAAAGGDIGYNISNLITNFLGLS